MVNSTAPWVGTMLHITIMLVGFFMYPSIMKGILRRKSSYSMPFVTCINLLPTITLFSLVCCWITDTYNSVGASIAFVSAPGVFVFVLATFWFCCVSENAEGGHRSTGFQDFRGGTVEYFENQVSHRTIALEMIRAAAEYQAATGIQSERSPYLEERCRSLQQT
jgi:hypothetical protein